MGSRVQWAVPPRPRRAGSGPQGMGGIESSFGGAGAVQPRVQWSESEWEVTKWGLTAFNSLQSLVGRAG